MFRLLIAMRLIGIDMPKITRLDEINEGVGIDIKGIQGPGTLPVRGLGNEGKSTNRIEN